VAAWVDAWAWWGDGDGFAGLDAGESFFSRIVDGSVVGLEVGE